MTRAALSLSLFAVLSLSPLPAESQCAWLPLPTPASAGPISDVWRDPLNPSALVATSPAAALTSSDGGFTWRLHPLTDDIALAPFEPSPTSSFNPDPPQVDDDLRHLEADLDALLDDLLDDTLDTPLGEDTQDPLPATLDKPPLNPEPPEHLSRPNPRPTPTPTTPTTQANDPTRLSGVIIPTTSLDTQLITSPRDLHLLHKGDLIARFPTPDGAQVLAATMVERHLVIATTAGLWHGRRAPLKRLTSPSALPGAPHRVAAALTALALASAQAALPSIPPSRAHAGARRRDRGHGADGEVDIAHPLAIVKGELRVCIPFKVVERRAEALRALEAAWSRERPLADLQDLLGDPTLRGLSRRLEWRQLAPTVELTLEANALRAARGTATTLDPDRRLQRLIEARSTYKLQWQVVAWWDVSAIVHDPQALVSKRMIEALQLDVEAAQRELARKVTHRRRLMLEAAALGHLKSAEQRAATALQIESLARSIEALSAPPSTP